MREVGAFYKIRLLMWKNFLQQRRKRFQTAIELLLPTFTLALILILRYEIEPISTPQVNYGAIPAHSLNYSLAIIRNMNFTRVSLAYSPQSPILENVLQNAVTVLLKKNKRLLPFQEGLIGVEDILSKLIKIEPYNTSSDLKEVYAEENNTRFVIAAVEFDDSLHGATELPKDLMYALRFPERPRMNQFFSIGSRTWRTEAVFPRFQQAGPRSSSEWYGGHNPGYISETFIALQHCISMELVSRLTNASVYDFEVNVQRYPHPQYMRDLAVDALTLLFPMLVMLSFSYSAVNLIRAVTEEKELQLKESMKIMGLPTWAHWTAWFLKQFIYFSTISLFVVIILKIHWFSTEDGYSDYAVFTNTPATVLYFFFLVYLSCAIFFCFMISGFFSKVSAAALFGGIIWFISYVVAFMLVVDDNLPLWVQAFICLSINSAMSYGFTILLANENTNGMQWEDFFTSPSESSNRLLFGHVVLILIFDCVLYMLITLYLEQVLPGPFGAPKPWYFPFQKQFWYSEAKSNNSDLTEDNNDDVVKERDPTNLPVGVKISNLVKIYGENKVVKNLSLNIYNDQITVLLGHNGAGKSTTISMLTGNVEMTSGSVVVAGYDISRQTRDARSHIGLCPQHNVLFNELTVREHLEFFSRLKGFSGQRLRNEIDTIIKRLELTEKRDYKSEALSGGQKRRLCVGIALCGGARVVLLDEPTSGMDPSSRRALWDLLQKEKKGRAMILTTHYMDEADVLGDRIAIMAEGRLQCVGSPLFLKQYYGEGYTLTVVKAEGFNLDSCTQIFDNYIPGIEVKEDRGTQVSYSLPNEYSNVFESLLRELEENKDIIKFKSFGLEPSTLEDVFLSVGSDTSVDKDSDSEDIRNENNHVSAKLSSLEQLDADDNNAEGVELCWQHLTAMWFKLRLVWMRSLGLVLLQLAVPILQINAALGILQYVITKAASGLQSRPLTLTEGYSSTETLVGYSGSTLSSLAALAAAAYKQMFLSANISSMMLTDVRNQSLDEYYLERTTDPVAMAKLRNRLLIGATFSEDSVTAWFSNFGYHDVATSLAAVHSALLKARDDTANLRVSNHPLEVNYADQTDTQILMKYLSAQLGSSLGNSMALVSAVYIIFYIKEKVSRAKLLQRSAGIQPLVMWGGAALFDWAWFLLICVTVMISCIIWDVVGMSTPAELGRMYLCLMVYGAGMLPLVYLSSNLFDGPTLGFVVMYFVNVLLGTIGNQLVEALSSPELDTKDTADFIDAILQFFPLYSLITSSKKLNKIGLKIYYCLENCNHLLTLNPNISECTPEVACSLTPDCCIDDNVYFQWNDPGILRYLVCSVFSGVILWIVLMIWEYRVLQKIFTFEKVPPPLDVNSLDKDVADEMRHAQSIDTNGLRDHSLVVKSLSKYYGKLLAVDQVSFTIAKNECFGLLGVNGAGKTTTFKMLIGDETISSGDAFVYGHSVKNKINQVYRNIGYCPQFDAVFHELTGRETLRLFLMLRGVRKAPAAAMVETLADEFGFTKHIDKQVRQYSGGTRRKLSVALSVCGAGARLVALDEPSAGVDAAARRRMWAALRRVRRLRALLLTAHGMDDCDALCTRLTLMKAARFHALGTPQYLKTEFSQGYTLVIKMKTDGNQTERGQNIKNYINSNFPTPQLKEEYQGMFTYHLPDRTMSWSRMFGVMERAKREYCVEQYTISQTSLEQVFLQLTKYHDN